jgi:hypothetical protein
MAAARHHEERYGDIVETRGRWLTGGEDERMARLQSLGLALVGGVVLSVLGGCGSGPPRQPRAVAMPASAPEDPAAYRGVRLTPTGPGQLIANGHVVAWLSAHDGAMRSGGVGGDINPSFGYRRVSDGRREMLWSVRTTGRLLPPPGSPSDPSPEPMAREEAVLDVAVLRAPAPGSGFRENCGASVALLEGDRGRPVAVWNLDFPQGRIRTVDPQHLTCPPPGSEDGGGSAP